MGVLKDRLGDRCGRLTVVEFGGIKVRPNGQRTATWVCKCDCGNMKVIDAGNLASGRVRSCGCLCVDKTREANTKHGLATNDNKTRLYQVWSNMKQRCYNPKHNSFKYYGGRGIVVCDEWIHSFYSFYQWAISNGYDENAPKGECTLDRIDCNGNYEPENCRWVDSLGQQNNRRITEKIYFNGIYDTLTNHARRQGIKPQYVINRLYRGWTVERALSQPVKERKKKHAEHSSDV